MSSAKSAGPGSFRDHPAEACGVELDALARGADRPGAAGLPSEVQGEVLTVVAGPFADHVGDDDAVVTVRQMRRPVQGSADVQPVHPGVAGQDDVDEVPECPRLLDPVDHSAGHRPAPDEPWCHPASGDRLRGTCGEPVADRRPGQLVRSLTCRAVRRSMSMFPLTVAARRRRLPSRIEAAISTMPSMCAAI